MAQDHSFDVVSKVNLQEVRNAIHMAQKEIATRFDFRGSSASVVFEEEPPLLKVTGDHVPQLNSVVDVIETKLAKRGVPLKAFRWEEPVTLPSGGVKRQAPLQQGIPQEVAKDVVKIVKGLGLKVQPRIEGETVRVVGRQIDDLQTVMQTLKGKSFDCPLQFENYR